jgi:hypothetical protein
MGTSRLPQMLLKSRAAIRPMPPAPLSTVDMRIGGLRLVP